MLWEEYATAWSALHGGFDPRTAAPVVRGWVRLAYRGGSLLGRLGLGPSAVTTLGLALCACVPLSALLPVGVALPVAAVFVLLAAAADSLDGAVAVVTGRVSRLGYVYDSAADRLGELAWIVAFLLFGAAVPVAVGALLVSWLHEYVRARAAAGGMSDIGVVTVGERPMRISVAISGFVVAALALPMGWSAYVVHLSVGIWGVLGLAGLAQLAVAVRRALR